MGRFNYEDEDFQDENLFPDTDNDEEFMQRQEAFQRMQLDIVKTEMNQRLLNRVIKMCESQAGWKTKGHKARLKEIVECYSVLSGLIGTDEEEVG